MSGIGAFFGFSTPIGDKIVKATSEEMSVDDWGAFLDICDEINSTEDGCKIAVKALRKRIKQKNPKIAVLALTVMETCVKNCAEPFHLQLASADMMNEWEKMLTSRDTPPKVKDKMLELLQAWGTAFRGNADLAVIVSTYSKLRNTGMEFPPTSLDALAPIYTPAQSVVSEPSQPARQADTGGANMPPHSSGAPPNAQTSYVPQAAVSVGAGAGAGAGAAYGAYSPNMQRAMMMSTATAAAAAAPPQRVQVSEEQVVKIRADLGVVTDNMQVFSEMVSAVSPGEDLSGYDVLNELHQTCKAMQHRILSLLEQVSSEELISELLVINDQMNDVFERYNILVRAQPHVVSQQESSRAAASTEGQGQAPGGALQAQPYSTGVPVPVGDAGVPSYPSLGTNSLGTFPAPAPATAIATAAPSAAAPPAYETTTAGSGGGAIGDLIGLDFSAPATTTATSVPVAAAPSGDLAGLSLGGDEEAVEKWAAGEASVDAAAAAGTGEAKDQFDSYLFSRSGMGSASAGYEYSTSPVASSLAGAMGARPTAGGYENLGDAPEEEPVRSNSMSAPLPDHFPQDKPAATTAPDVSAMSTDEFDAFLSQHSASASAPPAGAAAAPITFDDDALGTHTTGTTTAAAVKQSRVIEMEDDADDIFKL